MKTVCRYPKLTGNRLATLNNNLKIYLNIPHTLSQAPGFENSKDYFPSTEEHHFWLPYSGEILDWESKIIFSEAILWEMLCTSVENAQSPNTMNSGSDGEGEASWVEPLLTWHYGCNCTWTWGYQGYSSHGTHSKARNNTKSSLFLNSHSRFLKCEVRLITAPNLMTIGIKSDCTKWP